ncbi:protein RIK isoform X2 [Malania oleifera]|uniref:protein RIK isoform X2 n=1 Tax=Malania oleifera TaxID=397392 RepID=UPI0025ADD64C|nr:protein RIK isoform X2 [Malania oleifera]XP_057970056.1 protein RIK isoform X2 [Malania oleifera]
MTEETRVSSDESIINDASSSASAASKQRKKRKWDQPAESLVSAGVAAPGILPLGNVGSFVGVTLPGVAPVPAAVLMNPLASSSAPVPQAFQAPSIQQHSAAAIQKLNQPKIQDELIAREIVINDAESSVRYKLTKRQTQEEIQKCTGAVVITRGKYRPPNVPPDGEKPLYLHISAGANLKETAERIRAVDRAAAMVEEILKQGQNSLPVPSTFQSTLNNGVKVPQALSTCVFLGFDTDPSLNIVARIRGPNDQYINHIMNETGATVLLRGRGSGNPECLYSDEGQQPLHLFLSSNNPRSLENAKLLAENLLDTISAECDASRVSSLKVYNAVPPPQQLLAGVQNLATELKGNENSDAGLTSSNVGSVPAAPSVPLVTATAVNCVLSQGLISQSRGLVNCSQSQPNIVSHPLPSLTSGTSYSGYGGIYPQATPLQQVALALRQSNSPVAFATATITSAANTMPKSSVNSSPEKEKQPPQRRKFQELPVASKGPAKSHQVFSLTFYEAKRLILDL